MESDLPFGWNYGDAMRLARTVAATYRWGNDIIGFDEAYQVAYDGIIAHLFSATEEPARGDLYRAGARAIRGALTIHYRDSGRPAVGNGARFKAYWMGDRQTEPDHAPSITSNLAVWQVLEGLEPEDRETLAQLAHHLEGEKVREATGWTKREFTRRLRQARENFYRLWFEGETAPPIPKRVVVTIPQQAIEKYRTRGYVYPKENKSGTRFRARMRCQGRLMELGTHDTEAEAWAVIERTKANLVLDQFESDHRQEQPAAQQNIRADVGDRTPARVA